MAITAFVTYFHFAGIIMLFASLIVEAVLFKKEVTLEMARIIGKADVYYGIASIIILTTGFLKMLFFGKGTAYYSHNFLLWGKLLLFTVVGGMSVYPTIYFIRWRKLIRANEPIVIPEKDFRLISRLLLFELIIASSIPLLAVFMARGFGVFGS